MRNGWNSKSNDSEFNQTPLDHLKRLWKLEPPTPVAEPLPDDITSDIYQIGRTGFPRRSRRKQR